MVVRIHFGSRQRYRPSPCFVGAGPTFALGHSFVAPFWLRVWGVVAGTRLARRLFTRPPFSFHSPRMDAACWTTCGSTWWWHSTSWERRRRTRLLKTHCRHSPRKSMAECKSPGAAGCGNSSARAKTLHKLKTNCNEHSLYDLKTHSRHSPPKSMAQRSSPAAAGCGNSSDRAKNSAQTWEKLNRAVAL